MAGSFMARALRLHAVLRLTRRSALRGLAVPACTIAHTAAKAAVPLEKLHFFINSP
jgi:hypothetical protein